MGSRLAGMLVLLPFLVSGCGTVRINNVDGRLAFPEEGERDAVLFVGGGPVPISRASRYFWGKRHTRRPERTFRELFHYAAADREGLRLSPAFDVNCRSGERRITDEDCLRELIAGARERGIDYVLTAEVESWYQSYILIVQWTKIRFTLSCYSVHNGGLIWTAEAFSRKWYATDREVLMGVLEEMFTVP